MKQTALNKYTGREPVITDFEREVYQDCVEFFECVTYDLREILASETLTEKGDDDEIEEINPLTGGPIKLKPKEVKYE